MAIFIQKNDLGKFSLSNGRSSKSFMISAFLESSSLKSLLNKIQVVDFEASKLEDFPK